MTRRPAETTDPKVGDRIRSKLGKATTATVERIETDHRGLTRLIVRMDDGLDHARPFTIPAILAEVIR